VRSENVSTYGEKDACWQKTMTGEVFALYNITAQQHPLYRSTVTENTLRQLHLEIPPTPLPQGQVKRFDHEQ
jgi:hypothetical protein